MLVSWAFAESKLHLPVIRSRFKLSPEGLNSLESGHTHQLDELNKLQRGIFMDLDHVGGYQVVQSADNL